MENNNITAMYISFFAFHFVGDNNRPLELGILNFVWRNIINISTNYIWNIVYKSEIINMTIGWILEVV